MKKRFFSILILLFITSCSLNQGGVVNNKEKVEMSINDLEKINIKTSEFNSEKIEGNLIEETTEEDIDELIDILFETNK